jgi:hypothetical protein
MMMRALDAGGIPALTDGARSPDIDNPLGYFEYEPVYHLREHTSWLSAARGRAVKIICRLLDDLPVGYEYRVVFMRRDLDEVLASSNAMRRRLGETVDTRRDFWKRVFAKEIARCEERLQERPEVRTHRSDHRALLMAPAQEFRAISEFLGGGLNIAAMQATIDPSLYRERSN